MAAILLSYFKHDPEITDWFIVHEVVIPDHSETANPRITYDREILRTLAGEWVVETAELQVDGSWRIVCSGSGIAPYTPEDQLPEEGVTLEWYRGKCDAGSGTFRLQSLWRMFDPVTGKTLYKFHQTDPFTVTEEEPQ